MTGSMIVPLVVDNLDSIERDRKEKNNIFAILTGKDIYIIISLFCSNRVDEEKESQLEIFWSDAVRTTDTLLSHLLLLLFVVCREKKMMVLLARVLLFSGKREKEKLYHFLSLSLFYSFCSTRVSSIFTSLRT